MHPYVHCSIIHSGQDMETTKVSSNKLLDKEDVVHRYNGTLLSYKKRWNMTICDNMGGSWEHHAKQSQMEKVKNHVISLMWDIKLKSRNEQMRRTKFQR